MAERKCSLQEQPPNSLGHLICQLVQWHLVIVQITLEKVSPFWKWLEKSESYLLSCFCRRSRRVSSWLRCWRLRLCIGVLRGGGEARLQLGTSWYWPPPRLSPQKLKMLDTPENASAEDERWRWRGSVFSCFLLFSCAVTRMWGSYFILTYLTARCRCSQSLGQHHHQCFHCNLLMWPEAVGSPALH